MERLRTIGAMEKAWLRSWRRNHRRECYIVMRGNSTHAAKAEQAARDEAGKEKQLKDYFIS